MTRDQLVIYMAMLVGAIWAIACMVTLVTGDATVLTTITPVMLIVTGALFVVGRKNGNGGGK